MGSRLYGHAPITISQIHHIQDTDYHHYPPLLSHLTYNVESSVLITDNTNKISLCLTHKFINFASLAVS